MPSAREQSVIDVRLRAGTGPERRNGQRRRDRIRLVPSQSRINGILVSGRLVAGAGATGHRRFPPLYLEPARPFISQLLCIFLYIYQLYIYIFINIMKMMDRYLLTKYQKKANSSHR